MTLKILILGIAKAGKTSMLLALDNKSEEIAKVKPTQGVSYNQVPWAGFEMALWDVAGQEVYQKKFFIEHDRNFAGINAIVFVFSIEEEDIFKDAFTLVKNVADIIEKMKLNVPVTVCIHKFDPYRREMANFQKNEKEIRSKLAKIMGKYPYEVFVTSIYDRASIVRAFASTIQKCVPQFDLILERLKELAQEFNSPMVLILDENSNIVGEWHDTRNNQEELQVFTENALGFSHIM
jgi:GTPase SAR1 family protein